MKPLLPASPTLLLAITLGLGLALGSPGAAWAGDDCRRPMAEWQAREAVTARAAELGLSTERLRIDDGCYEIRGRDSEGNRVELKLEPATLAVLSLEVRFRPGADVSRYLPGARAQPGRGSHPGPGPGRPLSPATPPAPKASS